MKKYLVAFILSIFSLLAITGCENDELIEGPDSHMMTGGGNVIELRDNNELLIELTWANNSTVGNKGDTLLIKYKDFYEWDGSGDDAKKTLCQPEIGDEVSFQHWLYQFEEGEDYNCINLNTRCFVKYYQN